MKTKVRFCESCGEMLHPHLDLRAYDKYTGQVVAYFYSCSKAKGHWTHHTKEYIGVTDETKEKKG